MFRGSSKPFSAVSVHIDRLTSEQYEEDDIAGIFDLVEVIRIQSSGSTEAARALRKKLKYGNPHRQLRALVLLDGLIENAGSRFQRTFADEPLLERLRLLPRDDVTDPAVRKKCQVLFVQWANQHKNTPGLERIANLYKELPKTHRPAQARQKVLQDTDRYESDGEPPSTSGSRSRAGSSAATPGRTSTPVTLTSTAQSSSGFSKLSKKSKSSSGQGKPFNLAREKDNMTTTIAQASIASTNLLNGLQLINRETQRVSDNPEVLRRFDTCKNLRRKILYYIQNVESDEWIGSLVNANDELIKALTAYEITDRSIDDDSDSDAWENSGAATPDPPSSHAVQSNTNQLAGLKMHDEQPPAKPPRPGGIAMPAKPDFPSTGSEAHQTSGDGEDDNDPFGDANAAPTPYAEHGQESPKQPQIVMQEYQDGGNLEPEEGDRLHRIQAIEAPRIAEKQDENERLTASTTTAVQKLENIWTPKSKRGRASTVLGPTNQQRSDLTLVSSPATSQLPQPPSQEEQIAIVREKVVREEFLGVEPWVWRQRRLRPDYAEDLHEFKDRKFAEPNPSLAIRLKRIMAKVAIVIFNPGESIARCVRCCWRDCFIRVYCPCCSGEVIPPRIMIKHPSNEPESNEFGRASVSHATPKGSMDRSRTQYSHLHTAHQINQSRRLLQPPKPIYGRDCDDVDDPDDNVPFVRRPSAHASGPVPRDTIIVTERPHEEESDDGQRTETSLLTELSQLCQKAIDNEGPRSPRNSVEKLIRFPDEDHVETEPMERMWPGSGQAEVGITARDSLDGANDRANVTGLD